MTKESVKNEIKRIHAEYEKEGGKSIKPSFNFIVCLNLSDDYIVTKTLKQAIDKAFEYGNKTPDIAVIYEVILAKDGTYKAKERYDYRPKGDLRESFACEKAMHVAWRTRGDLLEVVDDSD